MYGRHANASSMVRSYSVPPAINKELRGSQLADLKLAFAEAWDGEAMQRYADALAKAPLDEIELARPQIFFTVNNVRQRLQDRCISITISVKEKVTPVELVSGILKGVSKDAERLLEECDRSPKSRYSLHQLAGALSYLAEIQAFSQAVAESHDASFEIVAEEARLAFERIAAEADVFRKSTFDRYPHISEIIPTPHAAREAGAAALKTAEFTLPRLSEDRAARVLGMIGDHDLLWRVAAGQQRQQLIESGAFRPLTSRDAKEMTEAVRLLMADFDGVFNRHGFMAELRQIAAAFRYQALQHAAWSETYNESYIKRQRKSLYDSKAEHQAKIRRELKRLPKERARTLRQAANAHASANMMAGFLHDVGRALRQEAPTAFISFRKENGALVGELDVPSENAIVIYDDHFVRNEERPDAVYAVRMPTAELEGGVPPLEEVRERHFRQATNYHSLVECLGELDNDIERSYFFGGVPISGHDGFDVLEGATALAPDENSAGSLGMRA